jgi:hypothetical protein
MNNTIKKTIAITACASMIIATSSTSAFAESHKDRGCTITLSEGINGIQSSIESCSTSMSRKQLLHGNRKTRDCQMSVSSERRSNNLRNILFGIRTSMHFDSENAELKENESPRSSNDADKTQDVSDLVVTISETPYSGDDANKTDSSTVGKIAITDAAAFNTYHYRVANSSKAVFIYNGHVVLNKDNKDIAPNKSPPTGTFSWWYQTGTFSWWYQTGTFSWW